MALQIVESRVGDVAVLTVGGLLRIGGEAEELKERLQQVIAQGTNNILMSAGQLTYIDSFGLGELVACLTTVRKSGGSLKLAQPTEFVRDVLRITRLDRVFELYDSDEAALASFSTPDQADSKEPGSEQ